ncbi:MAG: hypothetical protein ACRCX2_12485, partial [Paraclostridium sp.]
NLMIGLLGAILGFIVMKHKLGYMVSWFNMGKYDSDKVASIVGGHVMLYGIIIIFLTGINYVTSEYGVRHIIAKAILISACAIMISIYYQVNKYAKLKEPN